MTSRSIALATLLGLLAGPTALVDAGMLIANGFDSPGTLFTLDAATGASSNPRGTGIHNLTGIAYRPSDGQLYGLTTLGGPHGNSLYRIDPTTGVATLVGATGLSNIFEGDLAIDPTTGTLYGIQDVPTASVRHIFTLDLDTGGSSIVGSIDSVGDLSAMAFDGAGNLHVLDTAGNLLLRVDKSTANILGSSPLSVGLGAGAGLAFDAESGIFYAVGSSTNSLYTLDPTTGDLSLVGPTDVPMGTRLAGLAVVPTGTRGASAQSMPEPSTFAPAAICGLLGLLALARCRPPSA